jgi:PAS domain S-box-containing protein
MAVSSVAVCALLIYQTRRAFQHLDTLRRQAEATAEAAARSAVENAARLQLPLEQVREFAIFLLDPGGRVVSWNAGAERLAGYRAEEIVGRHFSCFFRSTAVERGWPEHELRQALDRGLFEDEGWRVRKDGAQFWASVLITPWRDTRGRLRGYTKVVRDVTERHRVEQNFQLAVESAPSAMVMIDQQGRIILVNALTEKLFGYDRAELLGQPVEVLVPERFRDKHPEARAGFFARPSTRQMGQGRELCGRRKDGTEFPVEIALNPIESEEALLVLAAVVDISARKKAENALAESEQRFRATFDQAAVGIALVAPDGRWLRVNHKFCDLVGYAEEELLRRAFQDITHPADLDADLTLVRQMLAGEIQTYAMKKRYFHKDGHVVWVNLTVALVRHPSGEPSYFISIVEDISARVRAEEELRALNLTLERRVEERTAELRAQSAELERSNAELEQFAYVASHDLQEPLRMVGSYMQLLSDRYKGRLDEKADKYIGYAVDGAKRMQALIHDLLTYSRVGRKGKPFQPVNTNLVLAETLGNLQAAVQARGAVVSHGDLPTVLADASQLKQLFQNLIGNAVKFCEGPEPRVRVEAEGLGDDWRFAVRDNGIGIGPEHRERVFVIFQRLHTRAQYPGTGIGLAICRKVVERHGGRIWVESQPGGGSVFYFTIPRNKGSAHGRSCEPQAD